MSQKELLENKVLDARGVQVDSSGGISLVGTWDIGEGLDPYYVGGKRRIIKSSDSDRYFFLQDYGPGYSDFRPKDSYDTKWRRVSVVSCSPARTAYNNLLDSYDSCLEIDQFFPLLFNLDSIHNAADSTQIGMSDDSLYINLNMVIERIANDPAPMVTKEKAGEAQTTAGLSPKADSNIAYDDDDNLVYDGRTYRPLEKYETFSVRREIIGSSTLLQQLFPFFGGGASEPFMIIQLEDDFNVFSSYVDSTEVNVVYYNTTDAEWQHRVLNEDSSPDNWIVEDAFKDSGTVTSLTDSSQADERDFYSYNPRATYHLRDGLGIYHYPDFAFFNRIEQLEDEGVDWRGSFDSLGAPWSTWANKHRGFDFDFPTRSRSFVAGDDFSSVDDSYLPIPLGVIGLRDSN